MGRYQIYTRKRNNYSMRYMHESYIGTVSHFDRRNLRKTSLKMRRNFLRRRSGLPKMSQRMKYDDFPCYDSTHERFHDKIHSSDDDEDNDDDDAEKLRQKKLLRGLTKFAKRQRYSRYDAIEYVKKLGTLQTFLL